MKIFGHKRKPGKDGQIGVVQRMHMYVGNIDRKVSGGKTIPHCKELSSLVYKRGEGPLVWGVAHFESLGVYRFCLGFTIVKCLSRVSTFLLLLLHGGEQSCGAP